MNTLDSQHAERIARDRVYKAVQHVAPHLNDDECEAIASAYTHDFSQRVNTYTTNFNAVREEMAKR